MGLCCSAACPPCPGHRCHFCPGGGALPSASRRPPSPGSGRTTSSPCAAGGGPQMADPDLASPCQPAQWALQPLRYCHISLPCSSWSSWSSSIPPTSCPGRWLAAGGQPRARAVSRGAMAEAMSLQSAAPACGTAASRADGLRCGPDAMDGLAPQQSRCQCEWCRAEPNQLSPLPPEKGVHLRSTGIWLKQDLSSKKASVVEPMKTKASPQEDSGEGRGRWYRPKWRCAWPPGCHQRAPSWDF
ncbi:uncharacterized protein LOC144455114 isoform X2 [Phascolarctos cinereus]